MSEVPTPEFTALRAALADRYRLERELGAGGMATVYLAQDLRHDRRVAVKVLRPELAAIIGAQRFLAEIKTTANLQHPNILPLFDSGTADSFLFYVMPFVDGESLRDRLARERLLPVPDAVRIASEVADALDYAHRRGIVHRDIKPENILLQDGRALVSDFGIALAASSVSHRITETGISLGTPSYMSPEQAMGERTITATSDVYALGCVLYEMLSGAPPFTGPTAQAIVARVLTGEPEALTNQRRTIPPHVEAAVLQALEKIPADRFGSAAEFKAALASPDVTAGRVLRTGSVRTKPVVSSWLPWLLLLIAGALLVRNLLVGGRTSTGSEAQRFDIVLPVDAAWVDESGSGMALSPDGRVLAYTGQDSTAQRWVYLRSMNQARPVRIAGSESGGDPFFSSDGRWVGFVQQGLVKAPLSGGSPQRICTIPGYVNATMLENNSVVFADGTSLGLQQCSETGDVTTLLPSDSTEFFDSPHGLPGDRGVLFSIRRGSMNRLAVLDLQNRSVKRLEIPGTDPRYVVSGHIVYVGPDGRIRAVAFKPATFETSGEPVVIAEGVRIVEGGRAMMGVSRTGLIVAADSGVANRSLELVDREGKGERLTPRLGEFQDPTFSPDGRRIAVRLGSNIWSLDRTGGALVRLSADSAVLRPVWSPDGRVVSYVRQVGATVELRRVSADGSAPAESLLTTSGFSLWEATYTPDGRSLVVRTTGGPTSRDLWLVALDSARTLTPLLRTPGDEVSPSVSPDGRWLAYASNETGRYEVYVRPFPGMGARYPVSLDGGTVPLWSPRGDELFFRSGPALVSATVRTNPQFEVLNRRVLFSNGDYVSDPTHQGYDVAPDGQHFAMVRHLGRSSSFMVLLHQVGVPASPGSNR